MTRCSRLCRRITKARAGLIVAEAKIKKREAISKKQAVLAQKQAANPRKQALACREVVTQQAAEEAVRDEAVAKADATGSRKPSGNHQGSSGRCAGPGPVEETTLRHRTPVAPQDGEGELKRIQHRISGSTSHLKSSDGTLYIVLDPLSYPVDRLDRGNMELPGK